MARPKLSPGKGATVKVWLDGAGEGWHEVEVLIPADNCWCCAEMVIVAKTPNGRRISIDAKETMGARFPHRCAGRFTPFRDKQGGKGFWCP